MNKKVAFLFMHFSLAETQGCDDDKNNLDIIPWSSLLWESKWYLAIMINIWRTL